MRYWWVNQNQTYRHEVRGGYLWSPKRNANGARNPFYDSMREVTDEPEIEKVGVSRPAKNTFRIIKERSLTQI